MYAESMKMKLSGGFIKICVMKTLSFTKVSSTTEAHDLDTKNI